MKSCTASSYIQRKRRHEVRPDSPGVDFKAKTSSTSTYFVLIELVDSFCLHLLDGVVLACGDVLGLVYLGVLLSRPQQVHFFEVLLPKHFSKFDLLNISERNQKNISK